MIIIPAVDIRGGKCVRLVQGRREDETVFSDDPAAMAAKWQEAGAERLHVIDLDGAFNKQPWNLDSIRTITAAARVPVQLGGGIRDMQTISMVLNMGVDQVIIGTEAIRNPQLVKTACRAFPGRIIVGIDAREGRVAIEGWTRTTTTKAVDLARQLEDSGVATINFTDINRDGMQTGPNIEGTRKLAQAVSIPVVAAGGVSSLSDIEKLLPLASAGVVGVITGKALYSGSLDLQTAIALAKGHTLD